GDRSRGLPAAREHNRVRRRLPDAALRGLPSIHFWLSLDACGRKAMTMALHAAMVKIGAGLAREGCARNGSASVPTVSCRASTSGGHLMERPRSAVVRLALCTTVVACSTGPTSDHADVQPVVVGVTAKDDATRKTGTKLYSFDTEAPGPNCAAGGQVLLTGFD